MLIYCFIILNTLINVFNCLEFKDGPNEDGWVSPKTLFVDKNDDSSKKGIESTNLLIKLNTCKYELENCNLSKNPSQTELQFFNRFILSLKRQFSSLQTEHHETNGHYTCDINLSHSNFKYLVDSSDQSSSTEKLAILENIFTNIRWIENYQIDKSFFADFNLEIINTVLLIIFSAIFFVKMMQTFYLMNLSFYRIIFVTLLLLFSISVPWTWWNLYQKAKSKKLAEIYKGMPDSCNAQNISFWNSITKLFNFRKDECSEYFEKTEVHPFLEVTPTMALSVTVTRFLLEPAEYIGDAFRRFMIATFQDLPFYLYLPAIGFMLIIFLTVMFMICGYRVRSFLVSIEPSTNHVDYSKEVAQLQLENQQLQKKLLAIETSKNTNKIHLESGDSLEIFPNSLAKIIDNINFDTLAPTNSTD